MNKKLETFTDKLEDCILAVKEKDAVLEDILMEVWTFFTENNSDEVMDLISIQLFGEETKDILRAINYAPM